jgi:medium-chain acyl-[acyl-carrier-protein] hydrolase
MLGAMAVTEHVARPWIRTVRPEAPLRLLCLSYAGGGTVDFRAWADALLPAIDLCPVILPGRESRMGERAFDAMSPLVDAMVPALLPLLRSAPFAIYGHSMGSWVGFELVRALRRVNVQPVHLFVAARRAPHRPARVPALSGLPDPAFEQAIQERYGGIPEAVRANRELMALFLPTLRADFGLLDRYRYVDAPPLAVPITAFRGTEDRVDEPSDIAAWSEHTSGAFALHALSGGHFFLREARDELTDRINAVLRPHAVAAGR